MASALTEAGIPCRYVTSRTKVTSTKWKIVDESVYCPRHVRWINMEKGDHMRRPFLRFRRLLGEDAGTNDAGAGSTQKCDLRNGWTGSA